MSKVLGFVKKWKLIFFLLIALCGGFLYAQRHNFRLLQENSDNRGELAYDWSRLETEGFVLSEAGLTLTDNVNYENTNGTERWALLNSMAEALTEGQTEEEFFAQFPYPSITIENENQYIQKLKYTYQSTGRVEAAVIAWNETDGQGQLLGVYQDSNNQFTDASVQNLRYACGKIKIVFFVANDFTVTGVSRYNVADFNWIRFLVMSACIFAILFVLFSVNWIDTKLENMFVVLAFLIGGAFILAIPAQKTGWDESYHFEQAYTLFSHKNTGDAVSVYMDDTRVWPLNPPQSYEEYKIQNQYVNNAAVGTETLSGEFSLTKLLGYLAPAVGIKLATILKLPFTSVFLIGKLFALLFYIGVVYFAIRRMKTGKRLLTVMALLPTTMYMTAIYNRDSVIIACSFLATAYLFSLFMEEDTLICWKDYAIIMGSLFVISMLKVVYAPMLLMPLLLPKDKFADKKQRLIMQGGLFGICILLVLFLGLPYLMGSSGGDQRGLALVGEGAVISPSQQVHYILTHITAYARLLLSTINATFVDYTLGSGVWGTLGHYSGTVPFIDKLPIFLVFLILTDTEQRERDMTLLQRCGVFVLLAASVALIWTSMYMAYSAVGSGSIQGVQARYYLPVLLPFFLLLNTGRLENHLNKRIYTKFVLLVPVVLGFLTIYSVILMEYCS